MPKELTYKDWNGNNIHVLVHSQIDLHLGIVFIGGKVTGVPIDGKVKIETFSIKAKP